MRLVEEVASYPRPPLIELVSGSVEIWMAGQAIAQDQRYVRVCETFHPPTIYLHPSAFQPGTLHPQRDGLRSVNGKEWRPTGM
ncbi:MAG: hypothetical protein CM15mP39_08520 [Synechococcus sp.]|nr:MAG: hypothetical protein CM15mP39_08520 [Synechococcus sp.]